MQDLIDQAAVAAGLLRDRGETLAVVESSAGGLLSAALLAQPGASAFYVGGAVVYTAAAREALLGITPDEMAGLRSSSPPYAALLAARLRQQLGTVWAVAETGAAGPTGNRYGDAAGHSCLAIAGPQQAAQTLELASTDRVANMHAFTAAALTLLAATLTQAPVGPSPRSRS